MIYSENKQKGLADIVWMIILVIVMISAFLAWYAYNLSSIRSQVLEGILRANLAQAAVEEYMTENAKMPIIPEKLNWKAPEANAIFTTIDLNRIRGNIIINYTRDNGAGSIVLRPKYKGKPLKDGEMIEGKLEWDCLEGTLKAIYRPVQCRLPD
jgi:Pilin (bacterial filament)